MSTWQVWISAILIGGAIACPANAAWGQVQNDNTLGRDSSLVTSRDRRILVETANADLAEIRRILDYLFGQQQNGNGQNNQS